MSFHIQFSLGIIFGFLANWLLFTIVFKIFKSLYTGKETLKRTWIYGLLGLLGFGFYGILVNGDSIRFLLVSMAAYFLTVFNELYAD